MEKLHEVEKRPWVSRKLSVSNVQQRWKNLFSKSLLCAEGPNIQTENLPCFLRQYLPRSELDDNQLIDLLNLCSPEMLCSNTETLCEMEENLPENSKLETVVRLKDELKKRSEDKLYRQVAFRRCRRLHVVGKTHFDCGNVSVDRPLTLYDEIALVLHVFKPIAAQQQEQARIGSALHYKLQAEFAVLGSTELLALRKKILCVADLTIPGDFSAQCQEPSGPRASKVYPSGSFYINDTFYDDMSHENSIPYSKPIVDWARTRKDVQPMKVRKMEGVTFDQLEIRLGYPYVYLHQGNCEHLLVFVDIRMLDNAYDSTNTEDYPMLLKMHALQKRTVCKLCKQCTARWCVSECERLPDEVNFLCDQCYISYNFTVDGKPIGTFKAQHYVDWTSIL